MGGHGLGGPPGSATAYTRKNDRSSSEKRDQNAYLALHINVPPEDHDRHKPMLANFPKTNWDFISSSKWPLGCCEIQQRPGLRPGPHWGSLQRSPRPPNWAGGVTPSRTHTPRHPRASARGGRQGGPRPTRRKVWIGLVCRRFGHAAAQRAFGSPLF